MTMPLSVKAYPDCEELWERAKAAPRGARACLGTQDAANTMRARMQYFRSLVRKDNAKTYPADHPLYGTSPFDHLYVSLRVDTADEWWVYVQPRNATILAIEEIGEDESPIVIDNDEVRRIEPPASQAIEVGDDLADAVEETQ